MAIERELAITYGSLAVGGASRFYKLTKYHRLTIGYVESVVEFEFVALGQDQPEFVAVVREVEQEFRTPHQTLKIALANGRLLEFGLDQHSLGKAGPHRIPTVPPLGKRVREPERDQPGAGQEEAEGLGIEVASTGKGTEFGIWEIGARARSTGVGVSGVWHG